MWSFGTTEVAFPSRTTRPTEPVVKDQQQAIMPWKIGGIHKWFAFQSFLQKLATKQCGVFETTCWLFFLSYVVLPTIGQRLMSQ